jgi:hypothetical protein
VISLILDIIKTMEEQNKEKKKTKERVLQSQ